MFYYLIELDINHWHEPKFSKLNWLIILNINIHIGNITCGNKFK